MQAQVPHCCRAQTDGLLYMESSSGNKAGMVRLFPVRTHRSTEGGSVSPGGVGLMADRGLPQASSCWQSCAEQQLTHLAAELIATSHG